MKTLLAVIAVGTVLSAALPSGAWAMIPPWYLYQRLVVATVGSSPCVRVSDLQDPPMGEHVYQLAVQACTPETATALAAVLVPIANDVAVHVLNPDGTNAVAALGNAPTEVELKQTLRAAFNGNPYPVGVSDHGAMNTAFSIAFKPLVVQIPSDNISDPYRNTNVTAQEAFSRVVRSIYGANLRIGFTTVPRTPNPDAVTDWQQ